MASTPTPQKKTGMVAVMEFFGMKAGQFRSEWAALSAAEKEQLKNGIENGTLTY